MAAVSIDIQANGLNRALDRMNRLVSGGKQLQSLLQGMKAPMGSGGGRSGGSQSGGGGGSSPSGAGGPVASLRRAQDNLRQAMRSGDAGRVFDAQYRLLNAEHGVKRAQERMQPDSFVKQLGKVFMSSRFSLGGKGGLFPLVGEVMGLVGKFGVVGKVALVLAEGLMLAGKMALAAAADFSRFHSAAMLSGGGTGTISKLSALGIPLDQIPQLAAQWRQVSQTGFGSLMRAQSGSGPSFRAPFGGGDDAAPLLNLIRLLASERDPLVRLEKARAAEMEALIPAVELYRRHADAIEKDAAAMRLVNNARNQQGGTDVEFQLGRLQRNLGLLRDSLVDVRPIAAGLKLLADFVRGLAVVSQKFMEIHLHGIQLVYGGIAARMNELVPKVLEGMDLIGNGFMGMIRTVYDGLKLIPGVGDKLPKLPTLPTFDLASSAAGFKMPDKWDDLLKILEGTDDLASALDRNTNAVNGAAGVFERGIYGGGQNARGAFPRKWTEFDAGTAGALFRSRQLGAWGLGGG